MKKVNFTPEQIKTVEYIIDKFEDAWYNISKLVVDDMYPQEYIYVSPTDYVEDGEEVIRCNFGGNMEYSAWTYLLIVNLKKNILTFRLWNRVLEIKNALEVKVDLNTEEQEGILPRTALLEWVLDNIAANYNSKYNALILTEIDVDAFKNQKVAKFTKDFIFTVNEITKQYKKGITKNEGDFSW